MNILHNSATLSHCTSELVGSRLIDAHESPARILSILSALRSASYPVTTVTTALALAEQAAAKVHTRAYLDHLRTIFATWLDAEKVQKDGCVLPECFPVNRFRSPPLQKEPKDIFARVGYYAFDMSTGISAATYESAIASADLARRGAIALVQQQKKKWTSNGDRELRDCGGGGGGGEGGGGSGIDGGNVVFALCRPPGHHCSADLMGGYCYLNNTAIAVRTLLDNLSPSEQQQQITVLDLDFHHGNGTQDIFYLCSNPYYISIHGEDEYPYFTGSSDERGRGEGEGYNLNLPIPCSRPSATTFDVYRVELDKAVDTIKHVRTKWLVVSMGFDTFIGDPIGKFALRRKDYREIGVTIRRLGIPTLVILEGGYVVGELGNNCVAFLDGLTGGVGAQVNGDGVPCDER